MTDITQTLPTHNISEESSLEGLCRLIKNITLMDIEKVLPAVVLSYDRLLNRAVVRPAISGIAARGQKIPKLPLVDIPVLSLHGGGIFLSFPIKEGDKGWLVACDRDISIFKQNLQDSSPNSYRKHCFNDAFFIPDKINTINVSEDDKGAVVISTVSGSTKFALSETGIKLTGNTVINGNVKVSGTLNADGDVVGSGISLASHTHSGVESGAANTGGPQ